MNENIIAAAIVGIFGYYLWISKNKGGKVAKIRKSEKSGNIDKQKEEATNENLSGQRKPEGEKKNTTEPTIEERGK
jgi:hypothetical protein